MGNSPMLTPPQSDVAGVVAGLTDAQRKALRAGSENRFKLGRSICRHAKITRWPSRPNYREFSLCWEYGQPGPWGVIRFRRLTPFGALARQMILAAFQRTKGDS
jgi:hypothetical protein